MTPAAVADPAAALRAALQAAVADPMTDPRVRAWLAELLAADGDKIRHEEHHR